MTTCTRAEFARRHEVTRAAVTTWAKRGWVVLDDELVDVEASEALLKKHRDSTRPLNAKKNKPAAKTSAKKSTALGGERLRRPPPDFVLGDDETVAQGAARLVRETEDESFDQSKARDVRYAGLLKQLDYDTKSGLVVLASEVSAVFGAELATVRTKLLAIPAEKASRLILLKTAQELQDALLELITDALSALAHRE